ncbi:hypothetical protein ACJIZ3_015894 [Penstemon smallii]|uniref:Uncharacterized protein n=1 Tax=Penstemon smallii TaxID=265156 RepID=A0ABD3RRP1_9LAMI
MVLCKEEKTGNAGGFSGEKESPVDEEEKAAADCFYEKLIMLNESSGLSLVFNFRETILDLHLFYKEVIKRGGFYQVTEAGKWDEVASTLNPKSLIMCMSPTKLEKVYEILILQYEQMYCKIPPEEANTCHLDPPVSPTGKKRKNTSDDCSQIYSGGPDDPKEKRKIGANCQVATAGSKTMDQNSTMITPPNSNDQEMRKDPDAPLKPRTGYQIFLKLECHRLKMIHGESSGTQNNIRDRAIQAWKCLPEKDKKPYIDASKLDKERYDREMASYMQRANNQNIKSQCLFSNSTPRMLNFSTSSKKDDEYHVSLQTKHEIFGTPDESMVELAIEEMKNAESNDRKFHMDWDN